MNKIVPFTKDITFKTKIGEISSISLDHDIKINNLELTGNFFIKGNYKMLETSTLDTEYSYKIPLEINISDSYDTSYATIDIDNFYYEIINEEVLRVHIDLIIEGLEEKDEIEDENIATKISLDEDTIRTHIEKSKEEIKTEVKIQEESNDSKNTKEERINEDALKIFQTADSEEKYKSYSIYLMQEEDTIESIMKKYEVTKEQLLDYNNEEEFKKGCKLVIPSCIQNEIE